MFVTADYGIATEEVGVVRKKIFPCNVCGKIAPNQTKLERHMLIHSGVKNFTCYICNKAFNRKDNLKVHIYNKHTRVNDV